MNIIDSHVHIGLISEQTSYGENRAYMQMYDLTNSTESTLALMRRYSIAQVIALPIPHANLDSDQSNKYVLDAYLQNPECIIPFCRIDNNISDNISRGFKGVKIHCVYEDVDFSKIKRELRLIEDACLPVIVHFQFKDKIRQIQQLLNIVPNIHLIIAHMGRGHLYSSEHVIENALAFREVENVIFETSTVGSPETVLQVCDIVGIHRVIYGSDYPFGRLYFGDKYNYEYDIIRLREVLNEEEQEAVFSSNIARIISKGNYNRIKIRRASPQDRDGIMKLYESLDNHELVFMSWRNKKDSIRAAAKSGNHCYVAVEHDKIVGYLRESGRPGGVSYLEEILVSKMHRKKGIAKLLMGYYHNIYRKTIAKTNAKNQIIIAMLLAHGYVADNIHSPRIIKWSRGI